MTTSKRRPPAVPEFGVARCTVERLLKPIGGIPPVELEMAYYCQQAELATTA